MNIQAMRDELARRIKFSKKVSRNAISTGVQSRGQYWTMRRAEYACIGVIQRHTRPERSEKGEK
jgi:hypothetical protein